MTRIPKRAAVIGAAVLASAVALAGTYAVSRPAGIVVYSGPPVDPAPAVPAPAPAPAVQPPPPPPPPIYENRLTDGGSVTWTVGPDGRATILRVRTAQDMLLDNLRMFAQGASQRPTPNCSEMQCIPVDARAMIVRDPSDPTGAIRTIITGFGSGVSLAADVRDFFLGSGGAPSPTFHAITAVMQQWGFQGAQNTVFAHSLGNYDAVLLARHGWASGVVGFSPPWDIPGASMLHTPTATQTFICDARDTICMGNQFELGQQRLAEGVDFRIVQGAAGNVFVPGHTLGGPSGMEAVAGYPNVITPSYAPDNAPPAASYFAEYVPPSGTLYAPPGAYTPLPADQFGPVLPTPEFVGPPAPEPFVDQGAFL